MNVHPLERIRRSRSLTIAGIMSGTSLDGIDVCLVRAQDARGGIAHEVLGGSQTAFPRALREALRTLAEVEGPQGALDLLARAHFALGEAYARATRRLVDSLRLPPGTLDAVGMHGQTVRHRPQARDLGGYTSRSTLQIGEAAVVAERLGCAVVSNFRSRDMAAGGQGAPLVPGAEVLLFAARPRPLALQNLGGIGNVTFLTDGASPPLAFDTGPANMPLDLLAARLSGGRLTFDRDGRMARAGQAHQPLVTALLSHPFFRRRPPRSAGREEFGAHFLEAALGRARTLGVSERDWMATLVEFVARSITQSYARFLSITPREVLVSGGGVKNPALMDALGRNLGAIPVKTSDEAGVPSVYKESLAFALLAYQTLRARPSGCPWATGASHPVIQGQVTF